MVTLVAGAIEQAEEDETRRHGGIQHAEENQRRDHEREGHLFVYLVTQRAECRRRDVLVTGVGVHDRTDQAEHDDLGDSDGGDRLPEILGFFHLGDKAWQGDLSNEGVTDIEEGAHS